VDHVSRVGAPGDSPLFPARSGPTGLLVIDPDDLEGYHQPPQPHGFVLGRLYGDEGVTRRSRRGMRRTYSGARDLLDLLRTAQRQNAGPRAWGRGEEALARYEQSSIRDHRGWLPDLFVSLDYHRHATTRAVRARNHGDREVYALVPDGFSASAGQWVGVDLDGFDAGPGDERALAEAARRIAAALERHPCFSGRMGLVRTSHLGVQIVAELAEARWDLRAFYDDAHVQRMLTGLDALCLREVRTAGFTGGHADASVHAPGRLVRRPGARRTKQGTLYVAHLVWATP
jgi:hypothetical protein